MRLLLEYSNMMIDDDPLALELDVDADVLVLRAYSVFTKFF